MKALLISIGILTGIPLTYLLAIRALDLHALATNLVAGGPWAVVTIVIVRWVVAREQRTFLDAVGFSAHARTTMFAIRCCAELLEESESSPGTTGTRHNRIWQTVRRQVQRLKERYGAVVEPRAAYLIDLLDSAIVPLTALSSDTPQHEREYARALAHVMNVNALLGEKCLPRNRRLRADTKEMRRLRMQLLERFGSDTVPWEPRGI